MTCTHLSTGLRIRQARKNECPRYIAGLAGAMSDLDKKPEVIDYIETFTLNTDSCFAVFS